MAGLFARRGGRPMTGRIDEAIEALLAYQQADMEGVMVLTSRQAIHEVADELRRLRNVLKAEWMPIDTAPRDGTDIIVYRPKFDGDYIPRVGTDYWMTNGVLAPTWGKSRKDCEPTHWMPFPDPPGCAVTRPHHNKP